jgi:hypothetical protein
MGSSVWIDDFIKENGMILCCVDVAPEKREKQQNKRVKRNCVL